MENQSDVVLVVESEELPAKRETLSMCSEYFRGMFSSNMREANQEKVEILNVNKEQMVMLLKLAEGAPFELDSFQELCSLTRAATMLLFDSVLEQCQAALIKHLSETSCLYLLWFSYDLALKTLHKKAWTYVLYYCEVVFESSEFFDLQLDEVLRILKDDGLHVSDELNVLRAIVKWVRMKTERLEHLDNLLSCVHWRDINVKTVVKDDEFAVVCQSDLWKKIEILLKTNAESSDNAKIPAVCLMPRSQKIPIVPLFWTQCNKMPQGGDNDRLILGKSKLFVCENETLNHLVDVPEYADNLFGSSVTTDGYDLYVSGGQLQAHRDTWNKTVWKYGRFKKKWTELCQMPGSGHQRHHASTVMKKYLYVMGGFGRYRVISNKAYRYSLVEKCWQDLPELPSPIFGALACVHDDKVFVMKGGVEYWAEGDHCWTLLNVRGMDWTSGLRGCCSVGSQIFVSTINKLIVINPEEGSCSTQSLPVSHDLGNEICDDVAYLDLQTIKNIVFILKRSMEFSNEENCELLEFDPKTCETKVTNVKFNFLRETSSFVKHFLAVRIS